MQVQGRDTAISSYVRYSGPLDCAVKTMKSEGVSLLFTFFSVLLVSTIDVTNDFFFLF